MYINIHTYINMYIYLHRPPLPISVFEWERNQLELGEYLMVDNRGNYIYTYIHT